MRWLIRLVALAAALILIAVAGVYFFFDVNQYRPAIEAELEKALKRKVALGALRLKLLPPSIAVENFSIAEDPAILTGRPFLAAREFSVRTTLGALLRRELKVESIAIVEPTLEFVRRADGKWNVESIGSAAASDEPAATADKPGATPLSLARLAVENGLVAVTTGKERAEYRNVNLRLDNIGFEGTPTSLAASVRFADKATLDITGQVDVDRRSEIVRIRPSEARLGNVRLTLQGSVGTGKNRAVDLRIHAPEASIAEVVEAAASVGAGFLPGTRMAGTAAADITVKGTLDKPDITGEVKAAKLEVSRAEWKIPVKVPAIQVSLTPGLVKSNRFVAQCGSTSLGAAFSLANPGAANAFLAATLTAADARLEELLHIAGAYGVKSVADIGGSGEVTLDARVMGKLAGNSPLAYSGTGRLRNARLDLPAFAKPVEVRQADLRFEQENAILDNIALSVAGSTLRGSLSVKRFSAPELRFKAEIDQIDSAQLRGITKPQTPVAPKGPSGIARLTGGGTVHIGKIAYSGVSLNDVRAEATLDRGIIRLEPLSAELYGGRHTGNIVVDTRTESTQINLDSRIEKVEANNLVSSMTSMKKLIYGLLGGEAKLSFVSQPDRDIASTLNGSFQMRLSDGRLPGVSILSELAEVAKAVGFRGKVGPGTDIVKLTATLKITNGVADTNDLRMDFAGGSLAARGLIGLADQSIKLKVTPVLTKQTSDQFGGGKVAGILTSALANKNGELVIPVLVSGTLAQPRFLPDGEAMAKMKLDGLLPAVSNPGALVSTVQGAIEEGRRGSVGGVIGILSGGKRPAAPASDAAKENPQPPPSPEPAPPEFRQPPVTPVEEGSRKAAESIIDLLKRKREKK